MKKIFTLIAFLAVTIGAMAQSQYFYEWKDGRYIQRSVSEVDSITFSLPNQAESAIVGAWQNGGCVIKFNADGTGTIEEEGEVMCFGYTFNNSTSVVTITSGVFGEEEIKQIKIKFIADNIIQLGWWINGEWYFEEDEIYYRQDDNDNNKEEDEGTASSSIVGVWEKQSGYHSGKVLIKFNADGTGSIEEEGEVLPFGYTFNSSTNVVTITSGVFWEEEIKQFKIKFIADNIIQLGWWIDGEWNFEEDEKYYRQDVVDAKANKVDLGLPSGTLWADRNVGADSPEASGDHFAWGETSTKSIYNWSTYKWCRGSENTMTKYCTNSSYGTVDNKTVLDLEDDAAYVNMGAEWRMPTETQMSELNTKCTWTWTTQNGRNGYKVTGPNGNSIFLPAAGCRIEGSIRYPGSFGNYLSASLHESYQNDACYLSFGSSSPKMFSNPRYYGHTVRAVAR